MQGFLGLQCFEFYDSNIAVKWVPLHLNQVEQWVHYETCYQSGTVLLWRGHVMLNNCDWWTWTRACEYEPEPKWHPPLSTFPMKIQDLTNSITHKSDDRFGMQHPRCCVSSSCKGPSCQWIALHIISAVALHIAVREKCPDLFEDSSILDYNATTHSVDTVKNAGQRWGWEVLWYFPYSPDFSPSDYDLFPKLKHPLHGKQFANREEILTAVFRNVVQASVSGDADGARHFLQYGQQTIDNLRYYFQGCFEFVQVIHVVPYSLGMPQ